jgi:hypothetical protein
MTKGTMTREQAIQAMGAELVNMLDSVNCAPTGRLQTDGDDRVEYSASISDNGDAVLTAYYYQSAADLEGVEDLSDLEWTIAGYDLT